MNGPSRFIGSVSASADPTEDMELATKHYVDNGKIFRGTCATAAGTAAKVVDCSEFTSADLIKGTVLVVSFTNLNTSTSYGSLTLNVNSTGAKNIRRFYNGTAAANLAYANELAIVSLFVYDGIQWIIQSSNQNSTYYYESIYCSTAATTAAKVGTATAFTLQPGFFQVLMINSNTYNGAITLNIKDTGAKPIYINGAASSSTNKTLPAGYYLVYYNGTNYYFYTNGNLYTKTITTNILTASELKGYVTIGQRSNINIGQYATAEGEQEMNNASGACSHAEGAGVMASGRAAHAEGQQTIASGDYSHAEGKATIAAGDQSHAEGGSDLSRLDLIGIVTITKSSSPPGYLVPNNSLTVGQVLKKNSNEDNTHYLITGIDLVTSGGTTYQDISTTPVFIINGTTQQFQVYSSAGGSLGNYSHTEGFNTAASRRSQHVFGEYNIFDTYGSDSTTKGKYVEIVGNGTANTFSNARTLDWDGNEELAGNLLPMVNNSKDLGTYDKAWKDIYAYNSIKFPNNNTIEYLGDSNSIFQISTTQNDLYLSSMRNISQTASFNIGLTSIASNINLTIPGNTDTTGKISFYRVDDNAEDIEIGFIDRSGLSLNEGNNVILKSVSGDSATSDSGGIHWFKSNGTTRKATIKVPNIDDVSHSYPAPIYENTYHSTTGYRHLGLTNAFFAKADGTSQTRNSVAGYDIFLYNNIRGSGFCNDHPVQPGDIISVYFPTATTTSILALHIGSRPFGSTSSQEITYQSLRMYKGAMSAIGAITAGKTITFIAMWAIKSADGGIGSQTPALCLYKIAEC